MINPEAWFRVKGGDGVSGLASRTVRPTGPGARASGPAGSKPPSDGSFNPSFALLRPRDDFYARAHPRPADTLLIIEVAHSTLAYDLEIKTPLYALAEIPEVWVVDLPDGRVHIFREPSDNRYRVEQVVDRTEVLRPAMLPSVQVPVRQILV
jgi:Uma2 family endonuclease